MVRHSVRTLAADPRACKMRLFKKSDARELKPGDPAPDFSLVGSDGKTYKLSAFRGRQAVVLAWFPKAFTGG